MIPRRFPFQWGAFPTVVPPVPPPPPLWNRVTATGSWGRGTGAARIPRFERLYAQVPGAQRSQNLIHRVQTQYPFVIATGNGVVVSSTVSEP